MALLEYIYTDTAPIEEGDALAIMAIADQFCLTRLVTLCEMYIIQDTQTSLDSGVKHTVNYVIYLLDVAKVKTTGLNSVPLHI